MLWGECIGEGVKRSRMLQRPLREKLIADPDSGVYSQVEKEEN